MHSIQAANDKVYQLFSHVRWLSPGTPAFSTTKTGRHDIAEILLKMALKHQKSINQSIQLIKRGGDPLNRFDPATFLKSQLHYITNTVKYSEGRLTVINKDNVIRG